MRWLRLMGLMRWVGYISSWFLVLCSWVGRERGKKRGFNHERTRKKAKKRVFRAKAQRRKGGETEEFWTG
jgi:hypothetical protein